MRNASSIARGASSDTSEPIAELSSRSTLIRPEPDADRQHEPQHLADAGVAHEADPHRVAEPVQRRQHISELHERAGEHPDGVRVEALGALEQRRQDDERGDDHQVPHERRDGRDREVLVRVEDPDDEAVEAEQDDEREHHLREPDGQVVELGGELVAGEQRHHDRGDEDEDDRERGQRDEEQAAQRAREMERLAPALLHQQLGEHGHEGGGQRRVRHQRAHQVRDLEGQGEGRGGALRAEVGGRDDLPDQPGHAREARGDREDGRVARPPSVHAAGRRGWGRLGHDGAL